MAGASDYFLVLACCISLATFRTAAGDNNLCYPGGDWSTAASPWYGPQRTCDESAADQPYVCPGLEFVTDILMGLSGDTVSYTSDNITCTCPEHFVASLAMICQGETTMPDSTLDPRMQKTSSSSLLRRISSPNLGFTFLYLSSGKYLDSLQGIGGTSEGVAPATYSCPDSTRLVGFQTQRTNEVIGSIRFLCKDVKCANRHAIECMSTVVVTFIGSVLGFTVTGTVTIIGFFFKFCLDKRLERYKGELQKASKALAKKASLVNADVENVGAASSSSAHAEEGKVHHAYDIDSAIKRKNPKSPFSSEH